MNEDVAVMDTEKCAVCLQPKENLKAIYNRLGLTIAEKICEGCTAKSCLILDPCPQCERMYLNLNVWGIKDEDGPRLCMECGLKGKKICGLCENAKPEAEVGPVDVYSIGWMNLCTKCRAGLIKCAGCQLSNIPPSQIIYFKQSNRGIQNSGDGFCYDCYTQRFKCRNCKEIFHRENEEYREVGDYIYCLPCFTERFLTCGRCGGYIERGNERMVHDEPFCAACYLQYSRNRVTEDNKKAGTIFNYRFDVPRGLGVKVDPTKKLFGVELEVCVSEADDPSTHAKKVYAAGQDMVVCKSDSSIKYGFEIVTAPLELDKMKEVLQSVLKVKTLQEHNSCGMHVHMSRVTIPRPAIAKTILFMHEPGNRGFINWVARRNADYYASLAARKWKDIGLFEGVDEHEFQTHAHEVMPVGNTKSIAMPNHLRRTQGWQNGGRYQAINLCNKNTIEFRVFASTVDPQMACANLEFCQALIDYTSELRPMSQVKSAKDFIAFVKSRKDYPAFKARLETESEEVEKSLKAPVKKKPIPKNGQEEMDLRPLACNHRNPSNGLRCNRGPNHLGSHRRVAGNNMVIATWPLDEAPRS